VHHKTKDGGNKRLSIREDLWYILFNYLPAKKDHKLYTEVRTAFKQLKGKIERLSSVSKNNNLIVSFGTGQTNIAKVPWLAILDRPTTDYHYTKRHLLCIPPKSGHEWILFNT
jgi:hypothetical protein